MSGQIRGNSRTLAVAAGVVVGLLWQLGVPVRALAEEEHVRPMFVPAFAFFGGITNQENSASVSSFPVGVDLNQIPGPPPGPPGAPDFLGPSNQRYFSCGEIAGGQCLQWNGVTSGPFFGSSRSVFPHVGASIELAAPVASLFGLVPFVHGDVALSFDVDHTASSRGDPDSPRVPVLGTFFPPSLETISGLGARASGEVEPWIFSAGAGLSFEFNFLGRTLRIKPSVEYRYDEVTASAFVSGAAAGSSLFSPPDPVTGAEGFDTVCPCITSVVRGSQKESFHSLGPGLELEVDAARAGPVMLTLFLSGGFYEILGNRTIDVEGRAPWDLNEFGGTTRPYLQTPDPARGYVVDPDLAVSASYERDKYIYRANVGLRFRWMPE